MTGLLVTGASGYLGAYLLGAAIATAPAGWDVAGTYFTQPPPSPPVPLRRLDLRDRAALVQLLASVKPDVVIHTACSNRDQGNVSAILPAAQNLADACREAGIRLLHVSTDLVFDGEHAPYSDHAAPAPILPYGRAKAEAEEAVAERCPQSVIVRPSLIWALDPLDRQTGWLVDGLRRGTPLTLFTDEIRCPVHLADLAAALLELSALPHVAGPINLGGRQPLSRWELGLRLLGALGLTRAENVQPGTVAASGLVRARDLTLDCRRAEQALATRLRGVDEILAAEMNCAQPPDGRAG